LTLLSAEGGVGAVPGGGAAFVVSVMPGQNPTPSGRRRRSFLIRSACALGTAVLNGIARAGDRTERLVSAAYADPVERYGHFALGRPHEYARLDARTDRGHQLSFELPADEVFEDLEPRLVQLRPDEPPTLLTIVSQRRQGARLVLFGLSQGRLGIAAGSRPIGLPHRWLNPVGVADLDGDGTAEIAAVTTPHVGGVLRVYRQQGSRLVELASLDGVSNHVYGSAESALSKPSLVNGQWRLLVPDQSRQRLLALVWRDGGLVEIDRLELTAPITGREMLLEGERRLHDAARGRRR
jgi:hypothetical protein